jgi:probable phosphoglycerate mutase
MQDFFEDSKAMQVAINLDSQLVERQLNDIYIIKDETLKTHADAIKILQNEFAAVTYTHVMREDNKEADRLVNEAIDSK